MSLLERQEQIVDEFAKFQDWEDRYKRIIEIGKSLPELSPEKKTEDVKVKGCQSQVWLCAEFRDGKIEFAADSDALLVRGLIAILLRVYSHATPQDILATSPDFIQKMGLESKLSPSRTNGLFSMIKQIKFYAMAFQLKAGLPH